ncbi:MAG: citryl-CoA lyase [Candidatus Magasanikbacteria bacterium]|jgi:citrate synthase|nr:citryl-CoA lyase [Candidatus Magasanikbacteria bacterium]MBT5263128.1 citryl-CoA lyase [Candidatus Magasanikbacteria bacterium]MBT5820204.1 citryl-CoA lyase [Candidatus Magasanikbacteria bacterium]MBT6294065.1 citryl-CoA lyase [Candidatus Magasanikbacteria bacterium]
MKFTTAITQIKDGKESVRNHALTDLIANNSFVQTIFLLLKKELPNAAQEKMCNALFTAVIDHGPGTASAMNARISASAGNSIHSSLAAGILGFGARHGVAAQDAMTFFYDMEKVEHIASHLKTMKEQKKYAPGFGHKIFTTDPRTEALFVVAKETNIFGNYCALVETVHKELNAISSKPLPINVDGAIAAILCDMDFSPIEGNAIFLIGRVPGLLAHCIEQTQSKEGILRASENDVRYIGS